MPISTVWILKYVQQCYVKRFWTISSLGAPDSGKIFRLTMYFKDWLVTWFLVFRLAAFYILTLMQFIPLECFQIILSRLLGIGLSVSQRNHIRRSWCKYKTICIVYEWLVTFAQVVVVSNSSSSKALFEIG